MTEEMSSLGIMLGKEPRLVDVIKEQYAYRAQVWVCMKCFFSNTSTDTRQPIDDSQTYKGRVLVMHNPGEDVTLYHRLIDVLGKHGYETFYCQMTNVYESSLDIYNEMSRMLDLCINDIDSQSYVKSHKLHLIGHFIGGSRILNYCVKGKFKHRIKSVISINPFLSPCPEFASLISQTTTPFLALVLPKSKTSALPIKYEHLTSDRRWLSYLHSKKFNFSTITANYLYEIQHISHVLQNKRKFNDFAVHNVLLIHSKKDPVSTVKGSEYFAKYCPAENISLLEYETGLNNLFIETDDIFKKLSDDLTTWLNEN